MNSLELYGQRLAENKFQRRAPEQKIFWANEVIKAVVAELNAPPFDIGNSPFVMETARIVDELKASANKFIPVHWHGKTITVVDAAFFIKAVRKFFTDDKYSVRDDGELATYGNFFFEDGVYTAERDFIAGIEQDLIAVQILLQEKQTQPPAPTKSVMDDYAAKTNAQIELQKQIAAVERERTKRSELRREKTSAWRDEQTKLAQSLKALQLPVQKILEDLRSFSDDLAENYIMQFAAAQIDLFNLIADNFDSHAPKAEQSQNRDYRAAVDNCKDYLEMIIDALAEFGVDEISSADGTPFDGKIHDVRNTKMFSPRLATVKKSLRPGFKFGERVLQKEAVEV